MDLAGAPHRRDELIELIARETALPAGRPVAMDVTGVGPATDRRQRDADITGRLGAREDELAIGMGLQGGGEGHWLALSFVVALIAGFALDREIQAKAPHEACRLIHVSAGCSRTASAAKLCGPLVEENRETPAVPGDVGR